MIEFFDGESERELQLCEGEVVLRLGSTLSHSFSVVLSNTPIVRAQILKARLKIFRAIALSVQS